jgi:hypothetical protein
MQFADLAWFGPTCLSNDHCDHDKSRTACCPQLDHGIFHKLATLTKLSVRVQREVRVELLRLIAVRWVLASWVPRTHSAKVARLLVAGAKGPLLRHLLGKDHAADDLSGEEKQETRKE